MPATDPQRLQQLRERAFDAASPSLAETGETALLRDVAVIAAAVGSRRDDLIVGPGDDAAIFQPAAGRNLVLSQDATVEDKDFRRTWLLPYDLGQRALRVALSDIAGSGARAELCLATLCAPSSTRRDDALAMQLGLCEAAREAGCAVAGGDISDIDGPIVIDVAVVGTCAPGRSLSLAAAKPGDALVVTGCLGRAAAGLQLLMGAPTPSVAPDSLATWRAAQIWPPLRLAEGLAFVEFGVRCGTDISDGLSVSAEALAVASGCAVELWRDALPVDADLRIWPDWMDLACAGGEDFELLVSVPAAEIAALLAAWPSSVPLTVIGRVEAGSGVVWRASRDGARLASPSPTSRHYG